MVQQDKRPQRKVWLGIARVLVDPVSGRLVGLFMVLLPLCLFGLLLWREGHPSGWLGGVGWLALVVPSFVLAGLIHEMGHMVTLNRMGAGARFTWRLPIDMRTLPRREDLQFHTCERLAERGASGFAANVLGWALSMIGAVVTGAPLLAYLSVWHGVHALTATAWVVRRPLTDAATLRQAVALTDCVELRTSPGPSATTTLELHIDLSILPGSAPVGDYWIQVQGLPELELVPASARPWIFSTGSAESLLLWRAPQTGSWHVKATGRPQGNRIHCLSKCGTAVEGAAYT